MKKILGMMMALVVMMGALVGCSSKAEESKKDEVKNVSVKELTDKMLEKEYIPMPMAIEEDLAKEAFHINVDNVEEYAITQTGRSPGIGLIVMTKAKEGKEADVKAAMEKLKEEKIGQAFYPDEVEAAKQAKILENGPYISLFILNPDIEEEALKMYEDALK